MAEHKWIKSTLGHDDVMCTYCSMTSREAAVLGYECHKAPKATYPMREQWIVYTIQNGTRHVYGPTTHAIAALLYHQFNKAGLGVDSCGFKTKALFDADEAANHVTTEGNHHGQ